MQRQHHAAQPRVALRAAGEQRDRPRERGDPRRQHAVAERQPQRRRPAVRPRRLPLRQRRGRRLRLRGTVLRQRRRQRRVARPAHADRQDPARHARRRHPRHATPSRGPGTARCNVTGGTTAGNRCQETFAWGLRNPFRMAFDPNAAGTRFFINDVGQNQREEIDLGQAGADYGWNCREGSITNNTSGPCNPTPAGMVGPVYEYEHGEQIPGTTSPSSCNAITGGAFVPERPLARVRRHLHLQRLHLRLDGAAVGRGPAVRRGRLRDEPGRRERRRAALRSPRGQPGAVLHDLRVRRPDPPHLLRRDRQRAADRGRERLAALGLASADRHVQRGRQHRSEPRGHAHLLLDVRRRHAGGADDVAHHPAHLHGARQLHGDAPRARPALRVLGSRDAADPGGHQHAAGARPSPRPRQAPSSAWDRW